MEVHRSQFCPNCKISNHNQKECALTPAIRHEKGFSKREATEEVSTTQEKVTRTAEKAKDRGMLCME